MSGDVSRGEPMWAPTWTIFASYACFSGACMFLHPESCIRHHLFFWCIINLIKLIFSDFSSLQFLDWCLRFMHVRKMSKKGRYMWIRDWSRILNSSNLLLIYVFLPLHTLLGCSILCVLWCILIYMADNLRVRSYNPTT